MHPTKTRIVYCRDDKRRGKYPNVKFDFLGYCFRPRLVKRMRDGILFCGFNPAVSPAALKSMRAKIRELGIRRRSDWSLADIAHRINPLLRGWINYYGRYAPSAIAPLLRYVNLTLVACAEAQTLQSSQGAREPLSAKLVAVVREALRALAAWHDRGVCLMGAE
jgi:RNA-directed DNA polymerase